MLLFRRVPMVLLFYKKIRQIQNWRQALFVGFFGPIGVSAIFNLQIALEFFRHSLHEADSQVVAILEAQMTIVVWFLVICSIVGSSQDLTKPNQPLTVVVCARSEYSLVHVGFFRPARRD